MMMYVILCIPSLILALGFELQRRLSKDLALQNIYIRGVDPNAVPTGITRRGNFMIRVFLSLIPFCW